MLKPAYFAAQAQPMLKFKQKKKTRALVAAISVQRDAALTCKKDESPQNCTK